MAVDLSEDKFQSPEHEALAGASDRRVEEGLELAKDIFVRTELGTLYLAAHFVALELKEEETPNVGAGVIASESTGPHSESYRQLGVDRNAAAYDTTTYGRRYLLLKRSATAVRVSII